MGTTNPLMSLLGKSPFEPLQEHMRLVTQCARQVPALFEALRDDQPERLAAIIQRINDLEHQADDTENALRLRLHKHLLMPVNRTDLLEIIELQDDIADHCQDIAGFLSLRDMELPDAMTGALLTLTRRCVEVCEQACRIQEELDELVEARFRGRQASRVLEMVGVLNTMESDTDRMAVQLVRSLFDAEDEMKPVSVVFWFKLITWVSNIADSSEKVGDRLRLLLAN